MGPILVHSENGSDVLPCDMKAEEVCEGVIETDPVFDLKRRVGRGLPNIRSTVGGGVTSAPALQKHPSPVNTPLLKMAGVGLHTLDTFPVRLTHEPPLYPHLRF